MKNDDEHDKLSSSALEFIQSNVPAQHLKWIDEKLCLDELGRRSRVSRDHRSNKKGSAVLTRTDTL